MVQPSAQHTAMRIYLTQYDPGSYDGDFNRSVNVVMAKAEAFTHAHTRSLPLSLSLSLSLSACASPACLASARVVAHLRGRRTLAP
jgi:hypothetical protein